MTTKTGKRYSETAHRIQCRTHDAAADIWHDYDGHLDAMNRGVNVQCFCCLTFGWAPMLKSTKDPIDE